MKIILAIFAIACTAALLALRNGEAPPAEGEFGAVATVGDGGLSLPPSSRSSTTAVRQSTSLENGGGGAGDDLWRAASERLDHHSSMSTLLRYRIMMFDSELIGSGMYEQAGQGSEQRYRLELKTQLGDKTVSLLHVCDAETLWTYRERSPDAQLERLDLRRVRAAQSEAAELSPNLSIEEGGLPKLIAGLGLSFRPLHAEAGYLGGMPMWAIEFEWKPSALADLIPEQREHINTRSADFSKLSQIPERVMVYLGHEDLFPRRIEFRKRASAANTRDGAGQGRAGEFVPALSVEFTDIRFNEPIDPRQFQYGAASAVDVTEAFLRSRGLPLVR